MQHFNVGDAGWNTTKALAVVGAKARTAFLVKAVTEFPSKVK